VRYLLLARDIYRVRIFHREWKLASSDKSRTLCSSDRHDPKDEDQRSLLSLILMTRKLALAIKNIQISKIYKNLMIKFFE